MGKFFWITFGIQTSEEGFSWGAFCTFSHHSKCLKTKHCEPKQHIILMIALFYMPIFDWFDGVIVLYVFLFGTFSEWFLVVLPKEWVTVTGNIFELTFLSFMARVSAISSRDLAWREVDGDPRGGRGPMDEIFPPVRLVEVVISIAAWDDLGDKPWAIKTKNLKR